MVLLTTDALAFTRLPFPEQVDLILVTAKDARVAAVTTVDGRVFETRGRRADLAPPLTAARILRSAVPRKRASEARFQGADSMSVRIALAIVAVVGGTLVFRPGGIQPELSADAPAADQAPAQDATTTLNDQSELAVTVYNSDIALVRDVRNLQLSRGVGQPAVHGHRRHREPGDRSLPIAHRAVAGERARAELRVQTCSSPTSCCASTSAAR